jgi:hypothetical protein
LPEHLSHTCAKSGFLIGSEQVNFFLTHLPFSKLTRDKTAYVAVRINNNGGFSI